MPKHRRTQSITVPFTQQNLPLEVLKQLIEEGLMREEIPFELLAEEYPSLLEEWYPGYPGMSREMRSDDPFCLLGFIENGTVSFKEMPELGSVPFESGEYLLEGEHKVWLKHENDSWITYVVVDDEL